MARARELVVRILGDSRGAEAAFKRASVASSKLDGALDATGKAAGGLRGALSDGLSSGAAVGGAALAAFAGAAVQAASDLGEQVSATKAVFREMAESVLAFGKTAADALGISNRAALEAANQFGDLFQNVGIDTANAAKFSQQLVRLAADLASFKNLDPGDVLARLQSGLVGETEPLRRLGVVINEAAVKAKALELGLVGANGEVSEGSKVQARYALILEKTTTAQGDAARTADSLANKQRRLNAQYEDSKAVLGEKFIPVAAAAVDQLDRLTTAQSRNAEVVKFGLIEYERNAGILEKLGQVFFGVKTETDRTAEGYEQLTAKTAVVGTVTQQLAEAAQSAKEAISEFRSELERLIGNELSAEEAASNYAASFDALTETIRENGPTLDLNTEKGRENAAVIRDLIEQTGRHAEVMAEQGESAAQVEATFRTHRVELANVLRTLGFNNAEIDRYVALLDGVPPSVFTKVALETAEAESKANELRKRLVTVLGTTITVPTKLIGPPNPNRPKFHQGGVVPGQPGAEVPILAEAGEVVLPRRLVRSLSRRRRSRRQGFRFVDDVRLDLSQVLDLRPRVPPRDRFGRVRSESPDSSSEYLDSFHDGGLVGAQGQRQALPGLAAAAATTIINNTVNARTDADAAEISRELAFMARSSGRRY